ncbi:TPA: hypothetical protein DCE37_20970 [Candidatus Latescibacteria bacterium]|nr:hypothetical protein [Candidatus Latescibacterota bacterium]
MDATSEVSLPACNRQGYRENHAQCEDFGRIGEAVDTPDACTGEWGRHVCDTEKKKGDSDPLQ